MSGSPCINACQLDNGICIGCGRAMSEITSWATMTDSEKQAVLEDIKTREYPTASE